MEWLLPLLGGLGIGSLITKVVDHILVSRSSKDERRYSEKREAYIGLLNALYLAAIEPSEKNAKNFALWQTRIELFGHPNVAIATQGMIDSNDCPREQRNKYFEDLIQEMRKDLNGN